MTLIEAQRIVQAYGLVLEENTAIGVTRDINSLPYSKDQIKEALQFALRVSSDQPMREHLKIAYISLADFQELSDEQIKALRNWNKTFVRNSHGMTLTELRDEATAMSKVGDEVIVIQSKSTAEMESLLQELKAAGF